MAKKKTAKKKNKLKKGQQYKCPECGMIVSVDDCGCMDYSDLECCGESMVAC